MNQKERDKLAENVNNTGPMPVAVHRTWQSDECH